MNGSYLLCDEVTADRSLWFSRSTQAQTQLVDKRIQC
jgi:hypothetical protein